eukprot:scaffold34921_cov236-Isochrysis_galbana.AAC.13
MRHRTVNPWDHSRPAGAAAGGGLAGLDPDTRIGEVDLAGLPSYERSHSPLDRVAGAMSGLRPTPPPAEARSAATPPGTGPSIAISLTIRCDEECTIV